MDSRLLILNNHSIISVRESIYSLPQICRPILEENKKNKNKNCAIDFCVALLHRFSDFHLRLWIRSASRRCWVMWCLIWLVFLSFYLSLSTWVPEILASDSRCHNKLNQNQHDSPTHLTLSPLFLKMFTSRMNRPFRMAAAKRFSSNSPSQINFTKIPIAFYENIWKKSNILYITYIVVGCVLIEVVYGSVTTAIWDNYNQGVSN